jgi:GntR family transcriptional repressor for pyruvate dehydrogenase complex
MNMKTSGVIKPQQLSDQVIGLLNEAIGSGEFAVGAKMPPEPQLSKELKVGRSTLREAVRVLAHQGVLEVRQGDGTYVRSLPADGEPLTHRLRRAKVSEIGEVRRALELEIVRLAAERHDEKDIENIRSFLEIRQQALARGDSDGALDADIAFHCAIAWATQNEVFADLYRIFAITLRHALAALWETKGGAPSLTRELHAQLVDAIASRDSQKAVAIASALLSPPSRRT